MSLYFDNAATTKVDDNVLEAIIPWFTETYGNASSIHDFGVVCKNKIEDIRHSVADYINCDSEYIYFCASSSEANSWFYRTLNEDNINFMVLSTDHIDSIQANKSLKCGVGTIGVNNDGLMSVEELINMCEYNKYTLYSKDFWICFNLVNAETGVVQNVKEISDIVHKYDYHVFCDLTQAITHIDIDIKDMGIDACTFSSHKIGGIKGCGVLYSCIEPMHLIFGHQENEHHGGTYNVPAIVSLGEALKLDRENDYIDALKLYFENTLLDEITDAYVVCRDSDRVNFISDICFKGVDSETLVMLLSYDGISVSHGSACNSYEKTPSHVSKAIGMNDTDALSCVRFSFSKDNTIDEIDKVIKTIKYRLGMLR